MTNFLILLVFAAVVGGVISAVRQNGARKTGYRPSTMPVPQPKEDEPKKDVVQMTRFRKAASLMTPAERSFYGVLCEAVEGRALVFSKVRMEDVIQVKKNLPGKDWAAARGRVRSRHFDFVLCDKERVAPLCAIELNDSSHNSASRKERDDFVNTACKEAGLPLVMYPAKSAYRVAEVREAIEPHLSSQKPQDQVTELTRKEGERLCPRCNAPLVKRVGRKGKNAGQEFWGCSAYPQCRHTEPIAEPS